MKIFEIIEYSDGGPNDRGNTVKFVKCSSVEDGKKCCENGFQKAYEITQEEYNKRKNKAINYLNIFNI